MVVQPLREGVGAGAGRSGELGGGPCGRSQPDDPVAGLGPGAAGRAQGAGLPGSGGGGQDGQEVPVAGQVQRRPVLPAVEPVPSVRGFECWPQHPVVGLAVADAAAPLRQAEDSGFGLQDLHGCVPGIGPSRGDGPNGLPNRYCLRQSQGGVGELLDPRQDLRGGQPVGG